MAVDRLEALLWLVAQLQPVTAYLAEAQANLPEDHPWSQRAAEVRQGLLDQARRFGKGEGTPAAPALLQELEALKLAYVAAYSAEHARLTLGPKADIRRANLTRDSRLAALRELSKIDLLDKNQLSGWQRAITDLPTCVEFHEGIIADTPTCPSCHLRPSQRVRGAPAEQTLEDLDRRLDDLFTGARRALRSNLQSDAVRQSLAAMTPVERQPIEVFLDQTDDELEIPEGFVAAATAALRGIHTVTIWQGDLMDALSRGGLPCTKEEFERRFAEFLRNQLRGSDPRTTRLMLATQTAELVQAAD